MYSAVRVAVVVVVDEEARQGATTNDENSSEAWVLVDVVVQEVQLKKEETIDLQLHGPAAAAEDLNEIWESRILPPEGVVLGMDVDV